MRSLRSHSLTIEQVFEKVNHITMGTERTPADLGPPAPSRYGADAGPPLAGAEIETLPFTGNSMTPPMPTLNLPALIRLTH